MGGSPTPQAGFLVPHRLRNARSLRGPARGGRHPDLSPTADHARAGEALARRPTQTAVLVDHLHGGFFPLYKSKALNHVGGFRSEMFFGFEELELGLRLRDNDYLLWIHGELWRRVKPLMPAPIPRIRPDIRFTAVPTWRRYYSLRNLIWICRTRHRFATLIRLVVVVGLAKPLVNLVMQPTCGLALFAAQHPSCRRWT